MVPLWKSLRSAPSPNEAIVVSKLKPVIRLVPDDIVVRASKGYVAIVSSAVVRYCAGYVNTSIRCVYFEIGPLVMNLREPAAPG